MDMGSCNTSVAYGDGSYEHHELFEKDGNPRLPSSVYVSHSSGGTPEFSTENGDGQRLVTCIKLLLGRKHRRDVPLYALQELESNGITVKEDGTDGLKLSFEHVEDNDCVNVRFNHDKEEEDETRISVVFQVGGKILIQFTAEDVMKFWITALLGEVLPSMGVFDEEARVSHEVKRVVFMVPNMIPNSALEAYRQPIGNLCPGAHICFLREPVAAFLKLYAEGKFDPPGDKPWRVLVVDIGDGTLDLALEEVTRSPEGNIITCLVKTKQSTKCAGKEQTRMVLNHLQESMAAFYGAAVPPDERAVVSAGDARNIKEVLCSTTRSRSVTPNLVSGSLRKVISATRKLNGKVPSFIRKWETSEVDDIMKLANKTLHDFLRSFLGEVKYRIDEVITVGGGVRGHNVRLTIQDALQGVKSTMLDSFVTVVKGGIAYSQMLDNSNIVEDKGRWNPPRHAPSTSAAADLDRQLMPPPPNNRLRLLGTEVTSSNYGILYKPMDGGAERATVIIPKGTPLPVENYECKKILTACDMIKLLPPDVTPDGQKWGMKIHLVEGDFVEDQEVREDGSLGPDTVIDGLIAKHPSRQNGALFTARMSLNTDWDLTCSMGIDYMNSPDVKVRVTRRRIE